MEITRILVGIDFSPESAVALEQAAMIARRTGADIVLCHAGAPPEVEGEVGIGEEGRAAQERPRGYREEAERSLASLCRRLADEGLTVSRVLDEDYPDEALPRMAEQLSADLLAVGTHGRSGIKRVLLGSVAERVIRHSARSVLVARSLGDEGGFRRILVPTDFSPTSEEALRMALVLAENGGSITLLHCWQLPALTATQYVPVTTYESAFGPLIRSIEEGARERGQALIDRHQRDGIDFDLKVVEASPAKGIRDAAGFADLVVVGSHGRRGVRRMLVGSVAETTARYAPCSVVVVHGVARGTGSDEE